MKEFIKKHDILLRLLSLVLAVILWIIALDETNPPKSSLVRDIPVTITGAEQLMQTAGLSVIEHTGTVNVRLYGPLDAVTHSSVADRVTVNVDVSRLTDGAGEYTLTPEVTVGVSGVEGTGTEPGQVRVLVDRMTSVTVPVRVETTGNPAEGYRAGQPEPSTTKDITIEGPASELEEVAYAYGTVNVDGRNSTFTEECTITLYNDAGESITGTHVSSQTNTVTVRVPIYPVESVPLKVTLTDGDTLTTEQVNVEIQPTNVRLLGDQNTLAGITEINLGTIDLDTVRTDVPVEMEIPLPEGVRLDSGQSSTAQVTITVKAEENVSTRSVEVTNFVPTDTAQEETPYAVSILTDSVEIEMRGSESALAEVDVSKLSIGLTFDSMSLGTGTHTVRGLVAATGLPAGVTLVEQDVEVEIHIEGGGV